MFKNTFRNLSYASVSILTLCVPATAKAGIIDCTVILCLPSGFPAGCAAAQAYMLDRLKVPKPPFGTCEGSGIGSSGIPYNVNYCASGTLYKRGGGRDEPIEYSCDPSFKSRPQQINYAFEVDVGNGPEYYYGTYSGDLFFNQPTLYNPTTVNINQHIPSDDGGNTR